MSLDPPLSDADLLKKALERGARVDQPPSDSEILRRAKRSPIDCGPEIKPEKKPSVERRSVPRIRAAVTVARIERHLEAGRLTGLGAIIYGAPRTKKNAVSGTGGFLATPGYKHWCSGIVAGFLPERDTTLPDEPLNLEAHFYVDVRGVPADLVGLLQGLCDALQAATVVRDDNWIRGFDGSRIHYDEQTHPRCQLELCPLKDFEKKS
jgi:hypothetical protein